MLQSFSATDEAIQTVLHLTSPIQLFPQKYHLRKFLGHDTVITVVEKCNNDKQQYPNILHRVPKLAAPLQIKLTVKSLIPDRFLQKCETFIKTIILN